MEFRYVYRRVEDAIGSPLNIRESLHSGLTRRLRYAVRERRDLAHKTEITALCLAALGGNSALDAMKIVDSVSRLVDVATSQALPYIELKKDEPQEEDKASNRYDEAFKMLAAFTESLNAAKAKKAAELVESAENGEKK